MTKVTWLLEADGGFIVRSEAGNFSYAYPTSPNAYRAKKDVAGKDRRHVAISMGVQADMEAGWCPAAIVLQHNQHLANRFDVAREQSGALLGVE